MIFGDENDLSLPYFLKYNYGVNNTDCLDKRGAIYVKKSIDSILSLFSANNPEDFIKKMSDFSKKIGIKLNLRDLGISKDELKSKLKVNVERLSNNPRKLQDSEYSRFFLW